MNEAVIIICSRPESSRVPGKVFREVAGVPAVGHILNRLKHVPYPVVLAVPPKTRWLYESYIDTTSTPVFYEGRADSPLHRMADFLRKHDQQRYVVRITHDDILSDGTSIKEMVDLAVREQAGYVYNPGIFRGADAEVILRDNILAAADDHPEPTEYISYFVKSKPNPKVVRYECRESVRRPYRLSFDYEEDGKLLEIVLRHLGPDATNESIALMLDQNPWLLDVNRLPKVTVYTCVRNGADFISDAIASVVSQSMNRSGEIEYIIVDDHSQDNTMLEVSKWAGIGDIKIVMNDRNLGLASSSNVALSKARGKYVIRLDADDKLYPEALKTMYDLMEQFEPDIIYPAYETGDGQAKDPRQYTHAAGAMMRTSALNEIRFKEGLKHWDSADLYARMESRAKVMFYEKPLFFYRQHARSLSASGGAERDAARVHIGA